MRGDEFFLSIAKRPPFTKLHPRVAAFFRDYFANEKVIRFGDQFVVNTQFPPFPSPAFDQLVEQFTQLGDAATRRLYSVTVAVTNRCSFDCWHCYNAGRSQTDLPLAVLRNLAGELQELGAAMVTLTGGEPLIRRDLDDIAAAFDRRSCVIVGTTGDGLTLERARRLRASGVFAVGISLDSHREAEHDRRRGRPGAFRIALRAIEAARQAGLYPYVVTVATRDLLTPDVFLPFLGFAAGAGALEVHVLEPSATGRLAGRSDVLLTGPERKQLFAYQAQVARDESLPILSSFAYLESSDAFGCGAGLTHLYVDGGGEVCPCNLVPLSFGNLRDQRLPAILARMGCHFCHPRTGCVGRQLSRHFPASGLPMNAGDSARLCDRHLPRTHPLPAFFRIARDARGADVGAPELAAAYNHVHGDYDTFWLSQAGRPVDALIAEMPWTGRERTFEAGCGTGYGTVQLAARSSAVVAVDLSAGMLQEAARRAERENVRNVRFVSGDALASLESEGLFDCIVSTWVLGYIPLTPFFTAAFRALRPGGRLGFVVHRENSPREPLEIFAELVGEEPAALQKRVAFDFPRDAHQVGLLLGAAGLAVDSLREDAIVFNYARPEQALEHLLKSGAGTAFYEALDPSRRDELRARFVQRLADRHPASAEPFVVQHDYVTCIARKPGGAASADST